MTRTLPPPPHVAHAAYGTRASGDPHGVVLTKPHVVDLILDLAGYCADRDLSSLTFLEPSCGHGAFLVPAVLRLLAAADRAHRPMSALLGCVLAFDIDAEHIKATKAALLALLDEAKVVEQEARALVDAWVIEGDFLVSDLDRTFDVVAGNPPYVRIEQVSRTLQAEYRCRYQSLEGRADLYVAFIERGLSLLSSEGILSFVCADRWVRNKYGAPLRRFISDAYAVKAYVDLHKASPFESQVVAYPSIVVLGRGKSSEVPVVLLDTGSVEECAMVSRALRAPREAPATDPDPAGPPFARHKAWFSGDDPWIVSSPDQLATLRALEARFAPIEATAHVGIGVATGKDRVYIVGPDADIEGDRLVPLTMRQDLDRGTIHNGARFVVNTFEDAASVIDLARYPRLHHYLTHHEADLKRRSIARKTPQAWYRTLDRVYPGLVSKPKLLIPDIAGAPQVTFDEGRYHPHHNLYFVTSEQWDLEVLGGLLSSRVALFFVWSYAVKMRGRYLRFQAQYLRRIHLPQPETMASDTSADLKTAFQERDFARLDELALRAYGLDDLPPFDFVDTRA